MKYSGIGGQAVLEGVMMKNGDRYAVAVRKPDQQIEIKQDEYRGFAQKYQICALPFIRGIFSFIDSMVLGLGTLNWSASFYEEDEADGEGQKVQAGQDKKGETAATVLTVLAAIVLAVGIFMVLPVFLANLLRGVIHSVTVLSFLEGLIRLALFVGYVLAISLMRDIRRVFMYHGAEHKCINCVEHGLDLTVPNVMASSRRHKRCGTSFLLIIMVISILLFTIVHVENVWLRTLTRIVLIPVVAGISYEFLRLAGRSENALVNLLSKPGLWLQGLTTREPDKQMVEVAIASVEAVFDWRAYLAENFGRSEEAGGGRSDV